MASCSEEVMDVQWAQTVVRKLRKKLRQIERLERLKRELTDEELDKIYSKDSVRAELSQKLAILGDTTSANVSKSSMMLAITDSQSDASTQNDSSYSLEVSGELSQKLAIATPVNVSNSSVMLAITDSQPEASAQNDSSYSVEKHTDVDIAQKELNVQAQNVNHSCDSELNVSDFPQVLHFPNNLEHNSEGTIVELPSSHMCSTPKSEKDRIRVEDVHAAIPDTVPNKIVSSNDTPAATVSPGSGSTHKPVKKRKKGEGGGEGKKKAAAATVVSKDARSVWLEKGFLVTKLEGHFDVVCSLDTNGAILMSGSRDTTVKVWCLHSLTQLHSMGGHKAAVTCVKILPRDEEIEGLEDINLDTDQDSPHSQLGISGSLDCQINIWDLDTGQKLGHIYTFSSITCLEYFRKKAITGSDGGKVEIWDLQTHQSLCVLRGPSKGVTSMCLEGHKLFIGDTGGIIEVWNIASLEQQDELVVPEKPDLRWNPAEVGVSTGGMRVPFYPRCVRCIAAHEGRVYWGDDGTNVKVLQCETGVAHRLTNHTHRFGSTGGLAVYPREKLLLAAGYDLDKGNANINVCSIPNETYLCSISISDSSSPYISCIVTTTTAPDGKGRGEKLRVCTGGNELKVWDVTPARKLPGTEDLPPYQSIAHCSRDSCYDASFYTDTESEGEGSSEEDSLSPSTLHTHPLPHTTPKGDNVGAVQRRESWLWWLWKCNIL